MSNIKKPQGSKCPTGKSGNSRSAHNSVSTTTSVNPIKVRPPKTTGGSGKNSK